MRPIRKILIGGWRPEENLRHSNVERFPNKTKQNKTGDKVPLPLSWRRKISESRCIRSTSGSTESFVSYTRYVTCIWKYTYHRVLISWVTGPYDHFGWFLLGLCSLCVLMGLTSLGTLSLSNERIPTMDHLIEPREEVQRERTGGVTKRKKHEYLTSSEVSCVDSTLRRSSLDSPRTVCRPLHVLLYSLPEPRLHFQLLRQWPWGASDLDTGCLCCYTQGSPNPSRSL